MANKLSFSDLCEKANALPIQEVIEMAANCHFVGTGPNLKAHSPLRASGNLGSFNINIPANIFHDWKLDIVGGPVRFYMEYYSLEFVDAVKKLASDFGLGSFYGRISTSVERKILAPPPVAPKNLNLNMLDKTYRKFLSMLTLSSEDEALLKKRGLTDEDITRIGFKTFPRRILSMRKELEAFSEQEFGSKEAILSVPGFFKKNGELVSFAFQAGIIIPCENVEGKIVGLQIRRRDPDANPKYIWFSSAFVQTADGYVQDGMSPGSPIGFQQAKFLKKVFITEGLFKALAINKQYDMSAITVAGVNNWKPIAKTIEHLPKTKGFIVAYDSDMCQNLNVLLQAEKLGQMLNQKGFSVEYALWEYSEETKGIDDLIAKYGDIRPNLTMKSFEAFSNGVNQMLKVVDAKSEDEAVRQAYNQFVFTRG